MSSLRFDYDWVDFPGADLELVKLTFANLTIVADDHVVTRVLDRHARTTRNHVVTPLYPLAEWAASNWWSLLHEPEVPSRGITSAEYRDRHGIRRAREGYSLPDLRFFPEGPWARLEWLARPTAHETVDFLSGGDCRVRIDAVVQALSDLIDSVVGRLRTCGVVGSWLEEEWEAIQSAPDDEAEFCRAAARLGLSPCETDKATDDVIEHVRGQLPESLRDDVLSASPASQLVASADWVMAGLKAVESRAGADDSWRALRARLQTERVADLPWRQGYRMAQHVRQSLGLEDVIALDLGDLAGETFPILSAEQPPAASLDGVAGAGDAAPCCYTAKRRPEARKFLGARSLCNFFFGDTGPAAVLSSAALPDQQRGRAFAAELLAPAAIIRSEISGDEVGPEEIEDLAARFQVSPLVVGYQIKNHRLAEVAA